MDLLNLLTEGIASEKSIEAISQKNNTSPEKASTVLMSAVPMLISEMKKNAETEDGANKLSDALDLHAEDDVSDIADFLKKVDTEDGTKILNHIMGSKDDTEKVEKNLAAKTGMDKGQVAGILSSAAPLLLSFLGKEKKNAQASDSSDKGNDLVSMLGSILSGGSSGSKLDIASLISFATKDDDNDGKSDLGETLGKLLGGRKLF